MNRHFGVACMITIATLMLHIGCTSKSPPPGEMASPGGGPQVLNAPDSSPGQPDNALGIDHFIQNHWDVAEGYFSKAIEADPNLAEAHYNLAVSLDKMGNHGAATTSFRKAAELAPDNSAITESAILKQHVGKLGGTGKDRPRY